MKEQYTTVVVPQYGYRRLEPLPTIKEQDDYYREQYYNSVAAGGHGPDLRRAMSEDTEELTWLSQTTWRDIREVLDNSCGPERRLLDIGCGLGHFGQHMQQAGWHVTGIEPSQDISARFAVYKSIEECLQTGQRFEAVTVLKTLEHVVDPIGLLQSAHSLLTGQGILTIMAPNDFSEIQDCAHRKLGGKPWWIAIPDHINYFNFESLVQIVEQSGFQVIDIFGDFPMEMFLLFGDIYIGNSEIGNQCHKKRRAFEMSIPAKLRQNLYRCFARNGLGRNCLLFASRGNHR